MIEQLAMNVAGRPSMYTMYAKILREIPPKEVLAMFPKVEPWAVFEGAYKRVVYFEVEAGVVR